MALKLHDYQERAIQFCLKHKTVYLAMDLGLGKTAVALKVIEQTKQKAFVIAPLNVIYNTWPEEISKWTPQLTYQIVHGPNKDIYVTKNVNILLINYEGIKWLFNNIKNWEKKLLILDESSKIKSSITQRFKMLKKMMPLWTDYRLCLSATPAPNGYHELWSQYYMLDKGQRLFKSFYKYRENYFHYTGPPLYKTTIRKGAYEVIRDSIKDITYRLDANDYLNMPESIYNNIPLSLPRRLQNRYKELEDNFFLEFAESEATAFSAAALSMKLRQFIQGAVYTDQKDGSFYPLHQVKIEALKEILETAQGKPILCPIQFKFERKMIHEIIDNNIPCIAGGTSPVDSNRYIQAWNNGEIPLLLCHPASLSHGVNLQSGGHIMLWFGLTWSLEHYLQLNGRLTRQGQKETVVINHLIMKNTIDERVASVLKRKDAAQSMLLNALRR